MDWQRLKPRYWFQNHPTNMTWDRALNKALDDHGVTRSDGYCVWVGPYQVWASNWPYGYGSPSGADMMPTVATRKRLREAIVLSFIKEAIPG